MHTKPPSKLGALPFLQSFAIQSVKIASQQGCSTCGNRLNLIEHLGLSASGCFEQACREQAGLRGNLSADQYADIIVSLKNQIGGNFSRASGEAGIVRVINTRCPFGDAVKEAPELCRMTSSVFGGIAARNFGYAKVELKKRIATNDGGCEVCIYLDRNKAAGRDGDEYHVEGDMIIARSAARETVVRVEEKMRQAWCQSNQDKAPSAYAMPKIVAESMAMRRALEAAERVAPTTAAVLIWGETGVGKEIIARAVHALSPRASREFVAINCGAIPENLVESQLFGHEKGAFTGAYQVHHGVFERAEKSTLFLDEIDSLPLLAQARLLRVLQEGEYERVGGKQVLHSDVRIIAAANRGLDGMVKSGKFRQDLYYRLNVVPIHIPPLRERRDDASTLIDHILRKLAAKYGAPAKTLSERSWIRAMMYEWPGNVRELENVLERSFLFAEGPVIEDIIIGTDELGGMPEGMQDETVLRSMKKRAAMEIECKVLREALLRCEGNVSAAAREMGITPRAVHQKLRSHGIDPGLYRKRALPVPEVVPM